MYSIILKFASPLQSWGTNSHFETRQTNFHPSKSGVIGLLAGAMGLKRDSKEIKDFNNLDFGVRIDQRGVLHKDYQTAHKYKKTGELERTYVTNRYYLEDAVFLAALSHPNYSSLKEIEKALLNPYYHPYLGRRSCPVNWDFYLGIKEEGVINNLKTFPWQANKNYQKNNTPHLDIFVDAYLTDKGAKSLRKDRVVSFSQQSRQFDYRYESRISTVLTENDAELDYFGSIGG